MERPRLFRMPIADARYPHLKVLVSSRQHVATLSRVGSPARLDIVLQIRRNLRGCAMKEPPCRDKHGSRAELADESESAS